MGIVDYAHSPDALENLLQWIRKNAAYLICVFGCGGKRDAGKRPLMGAIAARYCDVAIICDDNPRQEDAAQIRSQICQGAHEFISSSQGSSQGSSQAGHSCQIEEIGDRTQAIQKAVQIAYSAHLYPAVVIVAGKGHENYQIFAHETIPFNDKEMLIKAFQDKERLVKTP